MLFLLPWDHKEIVTVPFLVVGGQNVFALEFIETSTLFWWWKKSFDFMMTILSFNMLFYKLSFVQCCSSLRCISFTYSWLVWRAGDTSVFRKTTILVQTSKKNPSSNKGRTQFYPFIFIHHRTAANAANTAITKSPPMIPPMLALSWFGCRLWELLFGGSLKKKKISSV